MATQGGLPTVEHPLLVGMLVDVSASMQQSMRNLSGSSTNRIEGFLDSLADLVAKGRDLARRDKAGKVLPLLRLFAYGFGFDNPLTWLFGGDKVRDLLELPGAGFSTIGMDQLVDHWDVYERRLKELSEDMLGTTPLGEAVARAADRFDSELKARQYAEHPILFILSDGLPTDNFQLATIREIQRRGVLVVSCFITESDVTTPRRLYGAAGADWPPAARMMFDCASEVPIPSSFHDYLREHRWQIEPGARLFAQINQSEMLAEFMRVLLSPLRDPADAAAPSVAGASARVFVSYNRKDEPYLQLVKDCLAPLQLQQRVEVWTDADIPLGTRWEEQIDAAIFGSTVGICLISDHLLASEFIMKKELPALLNAADRGAIHFIPVLVSPVSARMLPAGIARYQHIPADGTLQEMAAGERKRALLPLYDQVARLTAAGAGTVRIAPRQASAQTPSGGES